MGSFSLVRPRTRSGCIHRGAASGRLRALRGQESRQEPGNRNVADARTAAACGGDDHVWERSQVDRTTGGKISYNSGATIKPGRFRGATRNSKGCGCDTASVTSAVELNRI